MDINQVFEALKGTNSTNLRGSSVINDPNSASSIPDTSNAGNSGTAFLNLLNNNHANMDVSSPGSVGSNPMGDSGANNMDPSFPHGDLRGPDSMNNSGFMPGSNGLGSSFTDTIGNNGGNNLGGSGFINGAQGSFVYTIISNWYLLIALPAMTVTYNVLKTLQDKGILTALYNNVKDAVQAIVQVSIDCPQKIDDIELFFQCLGW